MSDVRGAELTATLPLVAFAVILGLAPGLALDLSDTTVDSLIAGFR
jgi:NADH:ubiquinone oxidoreductase subunit 4 (subunit M)